MPNYSYRCTECKKRFSISLTLVEYEKGRVKCPKCGSKKLEQEWTASYVVTSKKS